MTKFLVVLLVSLSLSFYVSVVFFVAIFSSLIGLFFFTCTQLKIMVPRNRKRKDEKTERPREFDGISFSSSSTPSRWFLLLLLRLLLLPGLDFASCASCPFQSQKEYRKMCSLFSPPFFSSLFTEKKRGGARVSSPDQRNTRTTPCCARASSSSSLDAAERRRRRRRVWCVECFSFVLCRVQNAKLHFFPKTLNSSDSKP